MTDTKIYDELPEGWRIQNGANNPKGFLWICNNKSRFGGEYIQALLRVKED